MDAASTPRAACNPSSSPAVKARLTWPDGRQVLLDAFEYCCLSPRQLAGAKLTLVRVGVGR